MKNASFTLLAVLALSACAELQTAPSPVLAQASAAPLVVRLAAIDAAGPVKALGTVSISETAHGLVFTPDLHGLPPGVHGFHVHELGSCAALPKDGQAVAGLAAGGHYDPKGSKKHGTAWGDGHLGDLPGLVVDSAGNASYAVLAPRLKLADIKGRSLMVHAGGDNHADHPMPLGGGGARMACGVIGAD
ncbi:Cu-Zn family superoxide dismutase [Paucibacter oligotrophus]|uniref:Superoxide dismutase [Cu-Zn] n=1 Tax=Roseateles oligotrophus TaxID=1769250 RepID=A0A840L5K3_9BURK|nr:superoxide dismutase family protein [Roseateles oligotrophus]MBB4843480.1 Cu-Zn family superoxide dismutase [Roseateles oligotrophus]